MYGEPFDQGKLQHADEMRNEWEHVVVQRNVVVRLGDPAAKKKRRSAARA